MSAPASRVPAHEPGQIPKDALPESTDLPWMIGASVSMNLLALAMPLLMLQVFDRILPYRSLETLALLVTGTALAVAAESGLRMMRSFVMVWAAARFEHGAMCDAVSRLLAAPPEQLESGGHADRFKAVVTLKEYFSGQTFLQLLDLPFTFLFLGLVAIIGGWFMAAVPVVGLLFYGMLSLRFGKDHGALYRERHSADRRRSNFLVETLGGIHTVKAMAMEGFMLRRYERLQEACANLTRRLAESLDRSAGIGGLFSPLMTVLVVATGGYLVVDGRLTNGELAACIMLVMRSLGSLQRVGSLWIGFQQVRALRDEVAPLFRHARLPEEQDELAGPRSAGRIELRHVCFRPPQAAVNIIDDVSLAVEAGTCVVISGANGSGRSTLLQLMGGFFSPDSGEILLDGVPLAGLDVATLRSSIAYVPENAQLFRGTILENISGFDPSRIERAMELARALGLDKFVARLPRGWESQVGEAAADNTPVGHRQRIAMVRALAVGAKVVLFDAANISMDNEGDAAFRHYLEREKGKSTFIIVTHRPSLQKIADRVLVMEAGRLAGNGPANPEAAGAGAVRPAEAVPIVEVGAQKELAPAQHAAGDGVRWERLRLAITHSFTHPGDLGLCLSELLRALNWRGDPRDVAEALPYFEEVLDVSGLLNCMAKLGYRVGAHALRLGEIDRRLLPCLFLPGNGPALVLLGRSGDRFRVFDPVLKSERELQDPALAGEVHFFATRDEEPQAAPGWVFRVLGRMRPLVGHAMLAALIYGLVLLPAPMFVMLVYSYVMPSGSLANLAALTVGAVVAIAIGGIFIAHRARILAFLAGRIDYLFGTAVFKQILALPPTMSEGAALGAQIARLSSFESIRDLFTGPIVSTLLESPALFAFVIALGMINPVGLFAVAITIALYIGLYALLQPTVDHQVADLSRRSTRRHEFMIETILKLSSIRECGGAHTWLQRFREISAATTIAGYQVGKISAALSAGGYLITTCGTLAVIVLSIVFATEGVFGIGTVIASIMLAGRIIGPVQTAFVSLTRIDRVRNAAEQMDRLMALRGERQAPSLSLAARVFRGHVELERVSFRYSLDTDPALVGVSLVVPPGKVVAVIGPNGGGKSTLLKLLAGLYQPQAGSVRLDDMDLRQIDPVELRRTIGYVPQECSLFRGTIAQNMRFVRPASTDEELTRALALAGALNDVALLPEGMHSRVGDGATTRLSVSLRQKLSLARAYLTRAPVLLFDEPANTLDVEGDRWFSEAIRKLKGGCTIFLVTHRPSHIRLADIAVVLQGGYVRLVASPADALKALESAV